MEDRDLLIVVEDLLRTSPQLGNMSALTNENIDWVGRLGATFNLMDTQLSTQMGAAVASVLNTNTNISQSAEIAIRRLLHTARWTLRQRTGGPTTVAVNAGMVFEYFNGLSKLIQTARKDILFVDPYLDAEFVERYLPFVATGVTVRLLGRERQGTLKPAAEAFAKQHQIALELRAGGKFHDRFLFIDKTQCFLSGASFKDGGAKTPTILVEITDAFAQVWSTYDTIWGAARIDFTT